MSNEDINIASQIEDLLQEKNLKHTLSRDALKNLLEKINDVEVERDGFKYEVKKLQNLLSSKDKELSILKENSKEKFKKLDIFELREIDLEKRERKCIETEIRNEYEKRRGDEHLQTVRDLHRNTEYRKELYKGQVMYNQPGYYAENGEWIQEKTVIVPEENKSVKEQAE